MHRVSILLPSLNQRQFLEARIDSLLKQSFRNWQAIVLDSHSNDGSWEFFQSVAKGDGRFQLHQIPAEGLYAALNHGLKLTNGEFIHIATADDSMASDFLEQMLDAFMRCPEAGIAVSDLQFINRDGNELSPDDLRGHFSSGAAKNLLNFRHVRTAFPDKHVEQLNYRAVPHDCLLHCDGHSVYFSLNQLLVRTDVARAAGQFQTNIGSVADFAWLLRLTNSTATVHVPKKIARWRFHGDQLSMHRDESRDSSRTAAAQHTLRAVSDKFPGLLSENDRAALLLPLKICESNSVTARIRGWFSSLARLIVMLATRPLPTIRALLRTKLRFGTRRHTLLPMIFEACGLAPGKLTTDTLNAEPSSASAFRF